MNKTEPIWHSSPPPHIGWWNASSYGNYKHMWRWWDGERWSVATSMRDGEGLAARLTRYKAETHDCIFWTDYYPENARVPRIAP